MHPIIIDQRIEKSVRSLSDKDLTEWIDFYDEFMTHLGKMGAPSGMETPWKTYVEREQKIQEYLIQELGRRYRNGEPR